MTAQEKAKELIAKYDDGSTTSYAFSYAKHCAVITVEEILSATGLEGWDDTQQYWQEVKQFIINEPGS